MQDSSGGGTLRFSVFEMDMRSGELRKRGVRVPLQQQPFRILVRLAERPGEIVTREAIRQELWPADTYVDFEQGINAAVKRLREALGDSAETPRFIETLPKRGYRFIAPVNSSSPATPETREDQANEHGGLRWRFRSRPHVSSRAWFRTWHASGATKWLIAIAAASVLALPSYVVVSRSRRAAPAAAGVPLTAYVGLALEPSISPDGNKVAFSWGLGGPASNWDIYVKSFGAGEPQRLTTDPARDSAPAWSPDGRQIAFVRSNRTMKGTSADVIVIPTAGGVERTVITMSVPDVGSQPIRDLDWAPDGQWIAVSGRGQPSANDPGGIWLVALDGELRRPLTNPPSDGRDHRPAFSPDRTRLAFLRTAGRPGGARTSVQVLSLSPDLMAVGPPTGVTFEEEQSVGLAWTPDGRGLVFSSLPGTYGRSVLKRISVTAGTDESTREAGPLAFGQGAMEVSVAASGRVVYSASFRDSAIWKLPLASLTDRAVAMPLLSTPFDEENPDYSPDGKRLTFGSTRSGVQEIWIANADGSSALQMTSIGGAHTANPRWSLDGQTILFNSRREGSNDLYVLRVDTRELRRLTDDPADEIRPRWSRHGHWIYFGSNRTGRFEVWRMPAGGGAAVQVTKQGGRAPAESPDGGWLYYAKGTGPTPFANSAFSIWRMPVEGGQETLVVEGLSDPGNFVIASRGIYFLAVGQSPEQTSIDFVDSGTGARTTIVKLGKFAWYGAALSPDERTMLFATIDSIGSNLMLVDGFR
jgi:Tol biopolymer transport system component/DNA-binding winged helix-turn-helix (wHTH) protein